MGAVYIWEAPEKGRSVHVSLDLVDRLGRAALDGLRNSGRGVEIGGLLLGRVLPGDTPVTVVEDFVPVASEHLRGESWVLSVRDRKGLENALRSAVHRRGVSVVGCFRTHTRLGLYLDQDDFSLFGMHFPGPEQVFLLVKPSPAGLEGGFFFWEEGDVHRQSPYLTFPFERSRLAPAAQPARQLQPGRAAAAPAIRFPNPLPARSAARFTAIAAGVVLLLVSALVARALFRTEASRSRERSALSLNVVRSGDGLRLTWDRTLPVVRSASRGVVRITEGDHRFHLDLAPRQLAQGSVIYFPRSSDVGFELDLETPRGTVTEFVRAVVPTPAMDPGVAGPDLSPSGVLPGFPPGESGLASANRSMPEGRGSAARPAPEPRPFKHVWQKEMRPALALLDPPPPLPAGAVPTPTPGGLLSPYRRATVTVEPLSPGGLTKALRRIAYLGMKPPERAFTPARPRRRIEPVIPASIAPPAGGPVEVDVKVRVDKSGKVQRTELLSPDSPALAARLASSAAAEWQFAPAQRDGKPVPSELVLHFRFGS